MPRTNSLIVEVGCPVKFDQVLEHIVVNRNHTGAQRLSEKPSRPRRPCQACQPEQHRHSRTTVYADAASHQDAYVWGNCWQKFANMADVTWPTSKPSCAQDSHLLLRYYPYWVLVVYLLYGRHNVREVPRARTGQMCQGTVTLGQSNTCRTHGHHAHAHQTGAGEPKGDQPCMANSHIQHRYFTARQHLA